MVRAFCVITTWPSAYSRHIHRRTRLYPFNCLHYSTGPEAQSTLSSSVYSASPSCLPALHLPASSTELPKPIPPPSHASFCSVVASSLGSYQFTCLLRETPCPYVHGWSLAECSLQDILAFFFSGPPQQERLRCLHATGLEEAATYNMRHMISCGTRSALFRMLEAHAMMSIALGFDRTRTSNVGNSPPPDE